MKKIRLCVNLYVNKGEKKSNETLGIETKLLKNNIKVEKVVELSQEDIEFGPAPPYIASRYGTWRSINRFLGYLKEIEENEKKNK